MNGKLEITDADRGRLRSLLRQTLKVIMGRLVSQLMGLGYTRLAVL